MARNFQMSATARSSYLNADGWHFAENLQDFSVALGINTQNRIEKNHDF
jgi:hypothetical protein